MKFVLHRPSLSYSKTYPNGCKRSMLRPGQFRNTTAKNRWKKLSACAEDHGPCPWMNVQNIAESLTYRRCRAPADFAIEGTLEKLKRGRSHPPSPFQRMNSSRLLPHAPATPRTSSLIAAHHAHVPRAHHVSAGHHMATAHSPPWFPVSNLFRTEELASLQF